MQKIVGAMVLCGLLMASLTNPIAAKDVKVGTVSVELVLPDGFCELNPVRSPDNQHIAQQIAQLARSGVQLLSISAACSELKAWRTGAGLLDHYIFYSTDAQFVNRPTPFDPEAMRKEICDQIHAQAAQSTALAKAMANAEPDNIARNIKINSAAVVAVDDNDPNACYTAVLQKMQTQLATEKLQLLIDTTVAIKGKIMFATAFMPFVDMQGVARSMAENRKFVASWRAANGM
jgi:hypothetical protein